MWAAKSSSKPLQGIENFADADVKATAEGKDDHLRDL